MKTHQLISMKSQGDGILTLNEIREGGGLKTTDAEFMGRKTPREQWQKMLIFWDKSDKSTVINRTWLWNARFTHVHLQFVFVGLYINVCKPH